MKTGWKTKGTGKGSLNLFLYTVAVCVKTAITQISQFLELWSTWSLCTGPYLSTAERQTWLQRVPSKEFFVIKRKKVSYLLSESPFKTNKPTSYSKPLRCDFRRCNELEQRISKIKLFHFEPVTEVTVCVNTNSRVQRWSAVQLQKAFLYDQVHRAALTWGLCTNEEYCTG